MAGLDLARGARSRTGAPEDLYRVGTATMDARVMLYAVALTLATPLVFGLTPAIGSLRRDLTGALKQGTRGASVGRGALRGRRALVVAQPALAAVIITAAGLMVRSYMTVARIDLGTIAAVLLMFSMLGVATTARLAARAAATPPQEVLREE